LTYADAKVQELSTAKNIMNDILQGSAATAAGAGGAQPNAGNGKSAQQQNIQQFSAEVSSVKRLGNNMLSDKRVSDE
jgi:hypothetical protein